MVATGWKGASCASNTTHRAGAPQDVRIGDPTFQTSPERVRCGHEQLASVRERQVPAVDALQTVLCEIAGDDDLGSDRQRILIESSAEHCIRSARFDFPGGHRTVGILHIDGDPAVRIDPFYFFYGALNLGRHVCVIFGRERVMCPCRALPAEPTALHRAATRRAAKNVLLIGNTSPDYFFFGLCSSYRLGSRDGIFDHSIIAFVTRIFKQVVGPAVGRIVRPPRDGRR